MMPLKASVLPKLERDWSRDGRERKNRMELKGQIERESEEAKAKRRLK
jgi:hypothetical protein